jgi:hypothetical protein
MIASVQPFGLQRQEPERAALFVGQLRHRVAAARRGMSSAFNARSPQR